MTTPSNTVTYVATNPQDGLFDTLQLEVLLAGSDGKSVTATAEAIVVAGLTPSVSPGAQSVEKGRSIHFGLAGLPDHVKARDLTTRWHVPGALGVLDTADLRGSELVTYTCTSASAGVETISWKVATGSGTITVEGEARDPASASPGAPFSHDGTWTVTIAAVGSWTHSRWYVIENPTTPVVARQSSGLAPTAATESFSTSFTLVAGTLTTVDGGSGIFSLDTPANLGIGGGDRGNVWVWGRKQRLSGSAYLESILGGADTGTSVSVRVTDATATMSPDLRVITGTDGTFKWAPDQTVSLEGELLNINGEPGRYTSWIKYFYGKGTFTLTRTGAAR